MLFFQFYKHTAEFATYVSVVCDIDFKTTHQIRRNALIEQYQGTKWLLLNPTASLLRYPMPNARLQQLKDSK